MATLIAYITRVIGDFNCPEMTVTGWDVEATPDGISAFIIIVCTGDHPRFDLLMRFRFEVSLPGRRGQ